MCLSQQDGRSLLKQAQADLNAGRYASAIQLATSAADTFRQSGDQPLLIRALTGVGLARMYSGDYTPALSSFEEARQLSKRSQDRDYEITSLNNVGTVRYFTGRYSEAMEAYREAAAVVNASAAAPWLASRRQLTMANTAILYQTLGQNDRALEIFNELLRSAQALSPQEQAQLLANVGVLRRRLGDPQKALDTYRAAQELYRKAGHRDGEISVLNNIGILQAMELGDYDAAAKTFTTALERAQGAGDRPLIVHARLYRGEAYFRDHRAAESAADFKSAEVEAAAIGAQEEEWKAEFGLARIALREGNKAIGIALLVDAAKRIEALRGNLANSSLKSAFLADRRDVYDLLIENCQSASDAFRYMEQSRARGLSDRAGRGDEWTLDRMAATLPGDTVLLEYWAGASAGAVVWIGSGTSGLVRFPISSQERRDLEAVPELLADAGRSGWVEALEPIGRKLLMGIPALQNERTQRLIIVPDGPFANIPFEALPFSGKLLIDRFTVSYAPAARLLTDRAPKRRTRWFWQASVEAFADPAPSAAGSSGPVEAVGTPRLPEASLEIEGIAGALGGRPALYSGASAVKAQLMHPSSAPVLHFATHAVADLEDPDRSYILLAPASAAQRYDYLFLKEVGDLPVKNKDLVTLSACKTGIGKIVPGEGVLSFARSFLAAGVPSVVTSLWAVPDHATSQLMIRFYERLGKGEPLADALRGAKLEFIRSGLLAHPANWAAFVLDGDGSARLPYVVHAYWLAVPVTLVAAALAALRIRARRAERSLSSRHPVDRGSALPHSR